MLINGDTGGAVACNNNVHQTTPPKLPTCIGILQRFEVQQLTDIYVPKEVEENNALQHENCCTSSQQLE